MNNAENNPAVAGGTAGASTSVPLLTTRVTEMLLRPGEAWPRIVDENHGIAHIYQHYLVFLAAIPAVAGFVGYSLVGAGAFGLSVRVPIVEGLVGMLVGYALSLVMVFVMALVAKALAPKFNGVAELPRAFQLMAYGTTAAWAGGVFSLLPSLAPLGLLAALYSVYLIYRGAPVLMQIPQARAVGYTTTLVVCGVIAGFVVALLTSLLTPGPAGLRFLGGDATGGIPSKSAGVSITVPGTSINIDTAKLEEASRRMEQAQARGDDKAVGQAVGDMLNAAMGGKAAAPIAPEALRALVPETLGPLPRTSLETRSDAAFGVQFTNVYADYSAGEHAVSLRVQDVGVIPMLAKGMAGWASSSVDRETPEEVERVFRRDGVAIKERYRKDGTDSGLSMLLPNGVLLDVEGNMSMDALRKAVESVPVARIAAMTR
ncbi:Yip1 family protein [Tibeticola sp.]|uniref:Yip1 family protein n=1 Tax=Tibeticola sp. TaxID=2005368 RepID=UPI0025FD06AC|nr:Yip1 family protein [Tibeticola sp.]